MNWSSMAKVSYTRASSVDEDELPQGRCEPSAYPRRCLDAVFANRDIDVRGPGARLFLLGALAQQGFEVGSSRNVERLLYELASLLRARGCALEKAHGAKVMRSEASGG